jgi:hypothetical protein
MGLLMLFFYCMIGRAAIDIFAIDTNAHIFFHAKGAEAWRCLGEVVGGYRKGREGGGLWGSKVDGFRTLGGWERNAT